MYSTQPSKNTQYAEALEPKYYRQRNWVPMEGCSGENYDRVFYKGYRDVEDGSAVNDWKETAPARREKMCDYYSLRKVPDWPALNQCSTCHREISRLGRSLPLTGMLSQSTENYKKNIPMYYPEPIGEQLPPVNLYEPYTEGFVNTPAGIAILVAAGILVLGAISYSGKRIYKKRRMK